MARSTLGVSIGSHSLRAVAAKKSGASWVITRAVSQRLDESLRANAGGVLAAKGLSKETATLGLAGRDVIIRYNQVPPVPDWRLRNLMKYEVMEVSGQSGGEVSADYRKLNLPDPEGTRSEETVLVCLARNAYLVPLMETLEGAGIKVSGGCPRSVALFNAFAINATYREDETSLLVHLGAQGMDLALQRGGELLFARNATPGGQAFTQAVATAFSTTESKAETLKLTKGDVTPRGQARYADPTSEKVANAMMATAGQIAQMIQSTLMIGRAQTKMPDLKVDRVLLAGGGASLKGLDAYLKNAMSVPVERFDPFSACDLTQMPEDEREALVAAPHEFAAVLGLAQMSHEPAAFRLEVLPEAVRKKREFLTKGTFAIAAGLVAAVALVVLWTARQSVAAENRRQATVYAAAERTKAKAPHDEFKKQVAAAQEVRERHRRIAQLSLPGVLLSDSLAALQDAMKDHPQVYLRQVDLGVDDVETMYALLHAKPGGGGGFVERPHRRRDRRAVVKVIAHVSEGPSPEKSFNDFVVACRAKAASRRILLRIPKGFQARERQFELDLLPGVVVRAKAKDDSEAAQGTLLRDAVIEPGAEGQEPVGVRGTTVDGVSVVLPKEEIDPEDWKALSESLPVRAVAPAGGS
jgi:type IV pilus assembly protein PilM